MASVTLFYGSVLLECVSSQIGQEIEVRPGIVSRDPDSGRVVCKPIRSRIISLFAETNELQFAVPGGLIGKCWRVYVSTAYIFCWV